MEQAMEYEYPKGMVNLDWVTTREPFSSLFPINPNVLEAVKESMRVAGGQDTDEPIVVWRRHDESHHTGRSRTVVDGHTRFRAAQELGLEGIYVSHHDFADEDEAIAYAIRRQVNRRNLGDAELARYVAMLDKRRQSGERTDLAQDCARSGKSAEATAEILGVSPRKVEQVRTVLDHADEETKVAVLSGEKTVNAAYQETQQKRRVVVTRAPEKKEPAPPQQVVYYQHDEPKEDPSVQSVRKQLFFLAMSVVRH
jgi:ParB-like chromosome segregation protein Spo0J